MLSLLYFPGRAFTSPEDNQGSLRLKLAGHRNEVFGITYLDTRHRLIEIEELFSGTVDGETVYLQVRQVSLPKRRHRPAALPRRPPTS